MATYCCDLEKLTTYLVGLGLPVTSCTTGHATDRRPIWGHIITECQ